MGRNDGVPSARPYHYYIYAFSFMAAYGVFPLSLSKNTCGGMRVEKRNIASLNLTKSTVGFVINACNAIMSV